MSWAICVCQSCGFMRPPEWPWSQTGPDGPSLPPPDAGDFWLCAKCGEVHRFREFFARSTRRLIVVRVPLAEIGSLPTDERLSLLAARERILAGGAPPS